MEKVDFIEVDKLWMIIFGNILSANWRKRRKPFPGN
jgi:hypothetical protein